MNRGERLVWASLGDGWTAFRRSALPLVAFALLVAGLLTVAQLPERLPAPTGAPLLALARRALSLAGRLAAVLVALWGTTGLLRGAAAALEGRRPSAALLLHRDGSACGRLMLAALLVLGLMALASLPGYALVALSARFAPASDPITALLVALLPLLPALVLLHALPLGPLLTAEADTEPGPGPRTVPAALLRSWRLVAAHRGVALVLAAVQLALLQVSGGLHPLLGVALGLPLAVCLGAAATRRLSRACGC